MMSPYHYIHQQPQPEQVQFQQQSGLQNAAAYATIAAFGLALWQFLKDR